MAQTIIPIRQQWCVEHGHFAPFAEKSGNLIKIGDLVRRQLLRTRGKMQFETIEATSARLSTPKYQACIAASR